MASKSVKLSCNLLKDLSHILVKMYVYTWAGMYNFDMGWIRENQKLFQTSAPNSCFSKWLKMFAVQSSPLEKEQFREILKSPNIKRTFMPMIMYVNFWLQLYMDWKRWAAEIVFHNYRIKFCVKY